MTVFTIKTFRGAMVLISFLWFFCLVRLNKLMDSNVQRLFLYSNTENRSLSVKSQVCDSNQCWL